MPGGIRFEQWHEMNSGNLLKHDTPEIVAGISHIMTIDLKYLSNGNGQMINSLSFCPND